MMTTKEGALFAIQDAAPVFLIVGYMPSQEKCRPRLYEYFTETFSNEIDAGKWLTQKNVTIYRVYRVTEALDLDLLFKARQSQDMENENKDRQLLAELKAKYEK